MYFYKKECYFLNNISSDLVIDILIYYAFKLKKNISNLLILLLLLKKLRRKKGNIEGKYEISCKNFVFINNGFQKYQNQGLT